MNLLPDPAQIATPPSAAQALIYENISISERAARRAIPTGHQRAPQIKLHRSRYPRGRALRKGLGRNALISDVPAVQGCIEQYANHVFVLGVGTSNQQARDEKF